LGWKGFVPLFGIGVVEEAEGHWQLMEGRASKMVGFIQLPAPPSASCLFGKSVLGRPDVNGLAKTPDHEQIADPVRNTLKADEAMAGHRGRV
jgi:hypothetical protein